jgi:hypothetical protein
VSPITLKQRFNVVATSPETQPHPRELPPQVDVRQNTIFAAKWLLASLKYLAQSSADLATYFETVGWRGFIQGNFDPPVPGKFSAKAGDIFPVFKVLNELIGFDKIIYSESSSPLKVNGLVLNNQSEVKILLANFSESEKKIEMIGLQNFKNMKYLFSETLPVFGEKIILPPNEIVILQG